jgi:hypothetical protein
VEKPWSRISQAWAPLSESGSNTAFGLANLRICDLRTWTPNKFADLRFADFHTQIFADLQLRNEPENLQICDLRTNKKIDVLTFDIER